MSGVKCVLKKDLERCMCTLYCVKIELIILSNWRVQYMHTFIDKKRTSPFNKVFLPQEQDKNLNFARI